MHGMDEQRRGDAFEREVHVADRQAADAELTAQVVAGGDARQHMNGAHRIVRDDAAQLLKLVASQHLESAVPAEIGIAISTSAPAETSMVRLIST